MQRELDDFRCQYLNELERVVASNSADKHFNELQDSDYAEIGYTYLKHTKCDGLHDFLIKEDLVGDFLAEMFPEINNFSLGEDDIECRANIKKSFDNVVIKYVKDHSIIAQDYEYARSEVIYALARGEYDFGDPDLGNN